MNERRSLPLAMIAFHVPQSEICFVNNEVILVVKSSVLTGFYKSFYTLSALLCGVDNPLFCILILPCRVRKISLAGILL